MCYPWIHRVGTFLATLLMTSAILATPVYAAPSCIEDTGAKTVVLLVHGFNSGQEVWDQAGFEGRIEKNMEVNIDKFQYQQASLQWVTDPRIGKALAKRITCLSESSKKNKGSGKVVIVAHSMGGLAVRQAIAEDPAVAKALGLVVTIATPHNGSFFDRQALALADSVCRLRPMLIVALF